MVYWPLMDNAITQEDKQALADFILTSDRFSQGENVAAFEREWNDWLWDGNAVNDTTYSLFVSSGSAANLLLVSAAMELYGIKPGDKVLVPACTWSTNIAPLMQLGLCPVFVDISMKNLGLQPGRLKRLAMEDIKMVFVTHLLGFPANLAGIRSYFPKAVIIEDACEATGARIDDRKIGSQSLGATFSFYYGHHMTTIEGGMVSTNNYKLYDLMKMKRSHGLSRESMIKEYYNDKYNWVDPRFTFVTDGFNFRNTEIGAVLGRRHLIGLDDAIARRNENYYYFRKVMSKRKNIITLAPTQGMSNFALPMLFKNKEVRKHATYLLDENGIESRPIVGGNMSAQPFVRNSHGVFLGEFPENARRLNETGIYVGNYPDVTEDMMKHLGKVLKKV